MNSSGNTQMNNKEFRITDINFNEYVNHNSSLVMKIIKGIKIYLWFDDFYPNWSTF